MAGSRPSFVSGEFLFLLWAGRTQMVFSEKRQERSGCLMGKIGLRWSEELCVPPQRYGRLLRDKSGTPTLFSRRMLTRLGFQLRAWAFRGKFFYLNALEWKSAIEQTQTISLNIGGRIRIFLTSKI